MTDLIVERNRCVSMFKELGLSAAGTWDKRIMVKHITSLPAEFDGLLGSRPIKTLEHLDLCMQLIEGVEKGQDVKIQDNSNGNGKPKKKTVEAAVINPRPQELSRVEGEIRKHVSVIDENLNAVGDLLREIRDARLWEGQYNSWSSYMKKRGESLTGRAYSQARNLIIASDMRKRLPAQPANIASLAPSLATSHLVELSRLAPNTEDGAMDSAKDFGSLEDTTVSRVLTKALDDAKSDCPSVQDIKRCVNEELGDTPTPKPQPKPQAKPAPKGEPLDTRHKDLALYLRTNIEIVQGLFTEMESVSTSEWGAMQKSNPEIVPTLARICEEMTDWLYRSQEL